MNRKFSIILFQFLVTLTLVSNIHDTFAIFQMLRNIEESLLVASLKQLHPFRRNFCNLFCKTVRQIDTIFYIHIMKDHPLLRLVNIWFSLRTKSRGGTSRNCSEYLIFLSGEGIRGLFWTSAYTPRSSCFPISSSGLNSLSKASLVLIFGTSVEARTFIRKYFEGGIILKIRITLFI